MFRSKGAFSKISVAKKWSGFKFPERLKGGMIENWGKVNFDSYRIQ